MEDIECEYAPLRCTLNQRKTDLLKHLKKRLETQEQEKQERIEDRGSIGYGDTDDCYRLQTIGSVMDEFITDISLSAFDRLLVHFFLYRDQVKPYLFMNQSQVRSELVKLSSCLKEVSDNELIHPADDESTVAHPEEGKLGVENNGDAHARSEQVRRFIASLPSAYSGQFQGDAGYDRAVMREIFDHESQSEEQLKHEKILLRNMIEYQMVDKTMAKMMDMVEKGFDHVRRKLENFMLSSPDQTHGSTNGGEDDLVEDEGIGTEEEKDYDCSRGVDLEISERSARQILAKTSYITHNMHPSLSVMLRHIAKTKLKCICLNVDNLSPNGNHDSSKHSISDKSLAIQALLSKVKCMVEEDYSRNRHSSNYAEVNNFRAQQLTQLANWSGMLHP